MVTNKKSISKNIFFGNAPREGKIKLNFKFVTIKFDEKNRTGTYQLLLDDPRWKEKKLKDSVFYIDSIDGYMISQDTLVESFNKAKKASKNLKGIPIYSQDFLSINKGAKTVAGIKKLLQADKLDEAFLSCHSIFLRRLRSLLFFHEVDHVSYTSWTNWNKIYRGANYLIKKLYKLKILTKGLQDELLEYNQNRNGIDHEIGLGLVESKDLIQNILLGVSSLDKLEDVFTNGISKK